MWRPTINSLQASQQPQDKRGPSPSFEISRPQRRAGGSPLQAPRLDQVNSASLITQARQVYLAFLSQLGAATTPPTGVILAGRSGRVVFGAPALLPNEVFVPADWLLGGSTSNAASPSRPRLRKPWPTPQA